MPDIVGRVSAALLVALLLAGSAAAQDPDQPPAVVETSDTGRAFLDGQVAEVYVDNVKTVAIMAQAPQSECPSNEYVYERERPKWLYQTGRLLVAQEEGAQIRISFTCYSGLQSINAIQFLSPPPGPVLTRVTPTQSRYIRAAPLEPVATDRQRPQARAFGTREQTRPSDAPAIAVSPSGPAPSAAPPLPGAAYTPPPAAATAGQQPVGRVPLP